jgi:hypothetical protein
VQPRDLVQGFRIEFATHTPRFVTVCPKIIRTRILHENAPPRFVVRQHSRNAHTMAVQKVGTVRVSAVLRLFRTVLHRDQPLGLAAATPELPI